MCDEICKYERFRERKWNKIRKREILNLCKIDRVMNNKISQCDADFECNGVAKIEFIVSHTPRSLD